MAVHSHSRQRAHASWIHEDEQRRRISELQAELEQVRLQAELERDKASSLIWLLAVRFEKLRREQCAEDLRRADLQDAQEMHDEQLRRRSSWLLGALAMANFIFLAVMALLNWQEMLELFLD